MRPNTETSRSSAGALHFAPYDLVNSATWDWQNDDSVPDSDKIIIQTCKNVVAIAFIQVASFVVNSC